MELKDKNVVITGASSGIGLELLKLLLQEGCRVVACSRHIGKISIDSERLFPKECDVSKQADLDALFDFAADKLGNVDLFIANAGFAYYEKLQEPDWRHIDAIFSTNVSGTIYCAEKMRKLHAGKAYNFVVTASAMGLLSLPGYALYSATKAALRGFADAYRFELEKGQHFQLVYPVATKTDFFKRAGDDTPVPWPTQDAETVARRIIRGIRRDRKRIYPSTMFRAVYIADRILPFILPTYAAINNRVFQKWLKEEK